VIQVGKGRVTKEWRPQALGDRAGAAARRGRARQQEQHQRHHGQERQATDQARSHRRPSCCVRGSADNPGHGTSATTSQDRFPGVRESESPQRLPHHRRGPYREPTNTSAATAPTAGSDPPA
jgi:hypothetical protein